MGGLRRRLWQETSLYLIVSYVVIISLQEGCLNVHSVASDGTGSIHKSKLNTNGSFSVGKTWNLSELRGIEVVNVCTVAISSIVTQLTTAGRSAAIIIQYHSGTHVQMADRKPPRSGEFHFRGGQAVSRRHKWHWQIASRRSATR